MSNGDAVLDNWEEIDDAEITDKLQKIQKPSSVSDTPTSTANTSSSSSATTLNEKPSSTSQPSQKMKLLQRPASVVQEKNVETSITSATPSPLEDMSETFSPVLMVLHKSDSSEYESANYAPATNSQTVKILRRPAQHQESRSNVDTRPKQPIKSLQQREQEYAEARLRILGAAKNPEDDNSVSSSVSTSTSSTTSNSSTSSLSTNASSTQGVVTPKTTSGPVQTNFNSLQTNQGKYKPSLNKLSQQDKLYYNNANNAIGGHLQRSISAPKMQSSGQILYNNHNPYYQALPPGHMNFYVQQQQQQSQFPPLTVSHYNNRLTAQQMKNANYGNYMPPPMHMNHMAGGNFNHQQMQHQQSWSPVVGGSVSSATLRQPPQHLQQQHILYQQQQAQHNQQQQQSYNDNILRLPRGPCPNGTMGFQVRR